MKPPLFSYRAPTTIDECVATLAAEGDAIVLAGGQSLLPAMNFRIAHPAMLVDIQRVAGLKGISVEGDTIVVKAMTRHREFELDPAVRRLNPLIAEAMEHVAHIPIRNRGTVVGSLCHADPSAEMPAILVLLGGSVTAHGPGGRREIPADEFYRSALTTTRREDEVIVEARFPVLAPDAGWAFDEVTRRHGDFAIAGVGAVVRLDAAQRAAEVAIAACGIADRPVRLRTAEQHLLGTALAPADLREAGAKAVSAVTADDDMHATASLRRRIVAALIERVVTRAAAQALTRISS
jgi:CO/xanthine dehydrogenase FAD-binding subunit